MKNAFATYHPAVNFLYFALVLAGSMLLMHPAALVISMAGAVTWSTRLGGWRTMRGSLRYLLPMLLLTALVNPLFNHAGGTILAYLPSGNPLTLESIAYGAAAAAALVTVVIWFSCYNRVITSDKFLYLFGRVIPALALVLSMVLRLVPRFQQQLRAVSAAQRCIGRAASGGSPLRRARHGIRVLSILLTWALENAVETADSMKSRGYGLPGRTSFSIYRMDGRDRAALWTLGGLGAYILSVALAGGFDCRYFPTIRAAAWDVRSGSGLLAYALLCAVPTILDFWEDRTWRHSNWNT